MQLDSLHTFECQIHDPILWKHSGEATDSVSRALSPQITVLSALDLVVAVCSRTSKLAPDDSTDRR